MGALFTWQPTTPELLPDDTTPKRTTSRHCTLKNLEKPLRHTTQSSLTMTTFEPSLSTTMRASTHDVPSMADQLPSINFGFDELRSRMNQFTARFDAFIEKGRRQVLDERNQYRMNVAELHGKQPTSRSRKAPGTDSTRRGPAHEEA